MNKKELQAIAQAAAKNIKTEDDLKDFQQTVYIPDDFKLGNIVCASLVTAAIIGPRLSMRLPARLPVSQSDPDEHKDKADE